MILQLLMWPPAPSVERWFDKLMCNAEGVLYEDVQVQIGVKSRYQGHLGTARRLYR